MQVYFNTMQIKVNIARSVDTWLKTLCECSAGLSVCIAQIRGSASATCSHSKLLFHSAAVENTALRF